MVQRNRWAVMALMCVLCGCRHHVQVAEPNIDPTADFVDLNAAWSLHVVAPLKTDEHKRITFDCKESGTELVCSPGNLAGYETLTYRLVEEGPHGVRIQLAKTEVVVGGKKRIWQSHRLAAPIRIPEQPMHYRLVFLIRESRSDHNMLFIGSRDTSVLNALTPVIGKSGKCPDTGLDFCVAVPPEVAVRPDAVSTAGPIHRLHPKN